MPTQTINKIHFFEDLSPTRFEDMCVQVVYRMRNWSSIHHFGRKGKDRGVDIYTDIIDSKSTERWFIQCKRYKEISLSQLKLIVDDLIRNNSDLPEKYVLIISCDISRTTLEKFQEYSKIKGVKNVEVIGASILETMLYSKHPDLMYVFFGINLLNQRNITIARIKRRLSMKRKIEKYLPKLRKSDVIIHDIHRNIYPEQEFNTPGISPWFKLEFCRPYHNGLSFYSAVVSVAIFNDGTWKLVSYDEKLSRRWIKINALRISNIPYDNIVDIDIEGDEYYPYPHIYCEFNNLGEPYEDIWYEPTDDYKKVILFLEKDKMIRKK